MTIQQEKHPRKEPYAAPEVEIVEVIPDGCILQASGGTYNNPFGPEQNWG